jgi:hypothetical protein
VCPSWNGVKVHYEARKGSATQRKLLSAVVEKENFGGQMRRVWGNSKRFSRYKNIFFSHLLMFFFYPEHGASRLLGNFYNFIPNYVASYPTRQYSSHASLKGFQISQPFYASLNKLSLILGNIFWVVIPHISPEIHQRFGGNYCLHLQCQRVSQTSNQQETENKLSC